MEIIEFIKENCNLNKFAGCKQLTWDVVSNLEDDLNDVIEGEHKLEDVVMATEYRIDTILEIMKEDLDDFKYLADLKNGLETLLNENN